MKKRWYIGTVIFVFTLLSVVNQQQLKLPNQEIVLQFSDYELNADSVKKTLAIVKKQLLELGVSNIQVSEAQHGKLKITYYSDTDVASIKNILYKGDISTFDYTSTNQDKKQPTEFPFDTEDFTFNFDIHEIQEGSFTDSGFQGTHTIEVESKTDRFLDPKVYLGTGSLIVNKENRLAKITYKIYKHITISISDKFYYIPEVRAGPIC